VTERHDFDAFRKAFEASPRERMIALADLFDGIRLSAPRDSTGRLPADGALIGLGLLALAGALGDVAEALQPPVLSGNPPGSFTSPPESFAAAAAATSLLKVGPAEKSVYVETGNKFIVGANTAGELRINAFAIEPLRATKLTKADAINLAAWLVALSGDEGEFRELLEAVKNT
jgi:hypothetical protein